MATIALGSNYNSFKPRIPHSNLDYWYGPYDSILEAFDIVKDVAGPGFTVGIKDNNRIIEYWFRTVKETYTIEDLEEKVERNEPTIISNINNFYNINKGDNFNSISVEYNGALRGLVAIYRNGSLIETLYLNKGNNILRLGLYDSYNEYNFTLTFSDIGGNPATITNNGTIISSNEISFKLSVGVVIIEDEFEELVNKTIINVGSTIRFLFRASYISSLINEYTLVAKLDDPISGLLIGDIATYLSKLLLLLSYTLPNDISIGEHKLYLLIEDIGNLYEQFLKEYSFVIVDASTRIIEINILNKTTIYSGKSIVFNTQIFSGILVSNVRLSYRYNGDSSWINLNSTINLNEIKTYSINAPNTLDPNGEIRTLEVRWNDANVTDSELFTLNPYLILVSTESLDYYFDANGLENIVSSSEYEWLNGGTENLSLIINKINGESNGFRLYENGKYNLVLDGNFGIIKGNLFKNISNTTKGFTLELKYDTKCIGDLNALVFKNELIKISYDKVQINILTDNGVISLSTSLSENRKIHLTWVVDYDLNDTKSNIEDFLDFPTSSIYINGSLCSAIPLGGKSDNTPNNFLNLFLNNSYYSGGTYFNCGTDINLSPVEYVVLAQNKSILIKIENNWYYNDNNLGNSETMILNSLIQLGLLNEIKEKVDIILNSLNIGVSNIDFFRFYSKPLKASEVYSNYKYSENNLNENGVPVVVFTTFDSEKSSNIINDLNNKNVLDDETKSYSYLSNGFADLQKMGLGEKSKQKTHFVYGRLLYYQNGFTQDGTPTLEFYTMTSTQGTSSLLYPVKNFKTTLCKYDVDNGVYKTKYKNNKYKLDKQKSNFGVEGWQEESKFTLKCDYMESAHFNNTPTCSFYNDIIDAENLFYEIDEISGNLINKYNSEVTSDKDFLEFLFPENSKSIARKNGRFDAIKGFPCVVYILNSDPINSEIENSCNNDAYLGTYMFNLDKSADSLGFEFKDPDILDKYNEFPLEGIGIAGRFIHNNRLYQAKEAMLTFDETKCVDITDEIIMLSYEGKANVRYSSGTFYSHSQYSLFGYREYLLNVINVYNTLSNNPIRISETESGKDPSEFYELPLISSFLNTYLGANSILSEEPLLSTNPIYYIGKIDDKYYLTDNNPSAISLEYTPIYLHNKKKWQNEDSEEKYFTQDYEDRWDYLLELDELADNFKDQNGKIDWHHTWGDGKTWGWKRIIDWVGEDFSVNKSTSNFSNYFNKDYCLLYYLLMMVFGQVDNAGKNCMWDTWDGVQWYPRPYDLDSASGLNNSGYENVPTYAEIAKELSPIGISGNENGSIYPSVDTTDTRYKLYTTTTSKFWNTFGKVFNTDICNMYKRLRDGGIYNVDTILNYYTSLTTEKLSPDFYNKDMVVKYIINYPGSSDYYSRIHGNRIESFYLWMKARLVFCDSLFGYDSKKSINLRQSASALRTTLSFEVYYPLYIHISIGSGQLVINLFCSPNSRYQIGDVIKDGSAFSTGVIANDKETDIYGGDNIKVINGLLSLLDSLTFNNAEKLVELNASNSTNLKSISLNNCKYLLKLNLSNCTRLNTTDSPINLSNSKYLKEVDFSGCTCYNMEGKYFAAVTLPSNSNLKVINFRNSKVLTIQLENALNVETFDIEGCDLLNNLTLINTNIDLLNLSKYNITSLMLYDCNNLLTLDCSDTNYINTFNISNCNSLNSISFNGSLSSALLELVLNGAPNLKVLDFNNSGLRKLRLSSEINPTTFNVINSSIELLNYGEFFDLESSYIDCSHLNSVTNLSFELCNKVLHIKNLGTDVNKYNITKSGLFNNCTSLTTLTNMYMKISGNAGSSIFYNCSNLVNFNSCKFDLSECTSLSSAFFNCDSISWSTIKSNIMDKLNDTGDININLSSMFTYKASIDEIPTGFFAHCKNVNNIDSMFYNPANNGGNSIRTLTKNAFLNGGTYTVLNKITSLSLVFLSNINLETIDDDLITTIFPNVSVLFAVFYNCRKLKIPNPNIFFNGLTNLTDVTGLFFGAGSLTALQGETLPLTRTCSYTIDLENNRGLTTCTNLLKVVDLFRGCSNLTLNISGSIFPSSVKWADNAFNGTNINFINSNVKYNGDIFTSYSGTKLNTTVGGIFANSKISVIPTSLFENINPISNIREARTTILSIGGNKNRTYGGNIPNNSETGVFLNNTLFNFTNEGDDNISHLLSKFKNFSDSFEKLFRGCTSLYVNSLDLSSYSNITNLSYMFEGCSNLNLTFINVPSTITNLSYMFSKAKIPLLGSSVKNLIKNKPYLTNISYIFLGDSEDLSKSLLYQLDGTEFENDTRLSYLSGAFLYSKLYGELIPAKLFDYCRSSLIKVDKLFDHCTYLGLNSSDISKYENDGDITEETFKSIAQTIEDTTYGLEDYEVLNSINVRELGDIRQEGDIKGLLSDCVNLTNTDNMFSWCPNLGGKLPSNIFAINNVPKSYYEASDEEVIQGTKLIGDIKEYTNYKYDKITNMSQMFYNTNFNNYYEDSSNNKLLILSGTFDKIYGSNSVDLNLSGMFAGLGLRYVGSFSIEGHLFKCLSRNGDLGTKTGIPFIINFSLFPNVIRATNLSYMFANSTVESVPLAFLDGNIVLTASNISYMFFHSRLNTLQTDFLISSLIGTNSSIKNVNYILYGCTLLASNSNATIPDFGSSNYSGVNPNRGSRCYTLTTGMNAGNNYNVASTQVRQVLQANSGAFDTNQLTIGPVSQSTPYPYKVIP